MGTRAGERARHGVGVVCRRSVASIKKKNARMLQKILGLAFLPIHEQAPAA